VFLWLSLDIPHFSMNSHSKGISSVPSDDIVKFPDHSTVTISWSTPQPDPLGPAGLANNRASNTKQGKATEIKKTELTTETECQKRRK